MATKKTKATNSAKAEMQLEVGDQPEFERDENFSSNYVNSTLFGFTRWDFQMVFGKVEISRDKDVKKSREVANITMTPQYAKALLLDYAKVLHTYEEKYGVIDIGVDITQAFGHEHSGG